MKKVFWILAGLGVVIYSNTFKFSFVFDDFQAIVNNPSIRSLDLIALWHAFNTRFIVGVSLALNYALGQDNVTGYHLFNTSIHILNAFFVFKLICLTPKTSKLLGFLVALIFLVHPVQTQAVTYIWQRATSLATFFYLGALVFYVRGRLNTGSSLLSPISYLLCLTFAVLGMFTKEIVFTLPFAILLYEVIFLRGLSSPKALVGDQARTVVVWVLLALTLFIIPWTMTQTGDNTLYILRPKNTHLRHQADFVKNTLEMTRAVEINEMPRKDFILTELNVLRTYLRLFILPIHQSVDYDYPRARSLLEPNTLASLLLLLSLLGSGFLLLKKHPLLAFGIFWFFLTASLEALVPQGTYILEHRLYLPMAGLSLFLVAGLSSFLKSTKRLTWVILGIAACFSFMTYQRNFVWKDEFTLWDDAVSKFPRNGRAYGARGNALLVNGFMDRALLDLNRSIELGTNNAEPYCNRGFIYETKGELEKALADCNKAIEINPRLTSAYNNRAVVNKRKGLVDDVLRDLRIMIALEPYRAVDINPKIAVVLNGRGSAFGMKGLLDPALLDFSEAIERQPNFSEPYNNRGIILKNKGMLNEALRDFNKAIELNPNFASAYVNRANLYLLMKEYDKSRQDTAKAQSLGFVADK